MRGSLWANPFLRGQLRGAGSCPVGELDKADAGDDEQGHRELQEVEQQCSGEEAVIENRLGLRQNKKRNR